MGKNTGKRNYWELLFDKLCVEERVVAKALAEVIRMR